MCVSVCLCVWDESHLSSQTGVGQGRGRRGSSPRQLPCSANIRTCPTRHDILDTEALERHNLDYLELPVWLNHLFLTHWSCVLLNQQSSCKSSQHKRLWSCEIRHITFSENQKSKFTVIVCRVPHCRCPPSLIYCKCIMKGSEQQKWLQKEKHVSVFIWAGNPSFKCS